MRHLREREVDPDERPEPLKAEPRDSDKGGVARYGVRARSDDNLDGVDDGKTKAVREPGVDGVVPRPRVDESARGRVLERASSPWRASDGTWMSRLWPWRRSTAHGKDGVGDAMTNTPNGAAQQGHLAPMPPIRLAADSQPGTSCPPITA